MRTAYRITRLLSREVQYFNLNKSTIFGSFPTFILRFTVAFVELGVDADQVVGIFMWNGNNTEVTANYFGTKVKQKILLFR